MRRIQWSGAEAAGVSDQWTFIDEHGGTLQRTFRFDDFEKAFGFMTRMAEVSEELDHHPDWRNSYGRVDVMLNTHDIGGLSEKDIAWAKRADALSGKG